MKCEASVPVSDTIGDVFGKYRLVRRLGQGSMGVVFLAEDTTLGREVALKVLDPAIVSLDDFQHRFQAEARTVARLNHPCIVRIHALERHENNLAIDMEYVQGGDLASAEREGRLTIRQTLAYLQNVLDALACCHDAGVVHRDVKPSNILLVPGSGARLSDFGLAKLLSDHHSVSIQTGSNTSLFVGTPRYAPPESWDDQEPSPAWDIYSVGVVLFEAVAGVPPYDGTTPLALLKQMLEKPAPPLQDKAKDVSEELGSLVSDMLERDPGERPQDAQLALDRLNTVPEFEGAGGLAASTMVHVKPKVLPGGHLPRSFLPGARRKLTQALGVGLVLLAVAVGAIFWQFAPFTQETPRPESVAGTGDSATWVFDTIDPADQTTWPGHLMMRPTGEPNQWSVLAARSTHLWFMTAAADEEGALSFTGNWAEYTDETALAFRYGTMEGTGYWLAPAAHMALSLDFHSVQEGLRWTRTFNLSRSPETLTGKEFVNRFMASEYAQPILYRELIPRGLAWAEALETTFIASEEARAVVPFVRANLDDITIDGRLDEAEWLTPHPQGQPGALPACPLSSTARLLVRYNTSGLYLGFSVPGHVVQPRLDVELLTGFGLPLSHSPRWRIQTGGTTIVEQRHLHRGQVVPWQCQWEIAAAQGPDEWQTELYVPFETLEQVGPPDRDTRWKLNCVLTDAASENGVTQPVAYWGSYPLDDVSLGTTLVFEGNE